MITAYLSLVFGMAVTAAALGLLTVALVLAVIWVGIFLITRID